MIGLKYIKITPSLLNILGEIDEFKGFWTALETYSTGLQALNQVAEHGSNLKRVFGPLQNQMITEEMIHLIHAMQVKSRASSFYRKTEYRLPVTQDGQMIGDLETAAPEDIEVLMGKLMKWFNEDSAQDKERFHPLITIAIFTAVFLQISPYEEGNLRVVRFLILLMMLKAGYTYAVYVPLDRIMNDQAQSFYGALSAHQASLETGKPDWHVWFLCFFGMLKEHADILKQRLEAKSQEVSKLPTLSAKILVLFEENQRLQMNEIIKLTRGRRATVKVRLKELTQGGYLKRHGAGRSTWYSLV